MAKIAIVFGIVIILSAAIHQSNGLLKCYSCAVEPPGTNCFIGVLSVENEQTCSKLQTQCVKAVAKLSNGTEYIARGCDTGNSLDCSAEVLRIDGELNCYYCDTDLCNSSEWNSVNFITMGLTAFVAYVVALK